MPPDDLESWRNFMLQQQAQFWSDLQEMKAKQAQTNAQIMKLVDVCASLTRLVEENTGQIQENGRLIHENDRLIHANSLMIQKLGESQVLTDQRLRALADLIERDRNGHA